ncbi:hypothetical protein GCM10023160_30710 [Brachybacterium paraconglomeratum]
MEFLFIIVIGVIFVVQFAMKQAGKDNDSGPSPWGEGSSKRSSRPRMRPRPQTPQPRSLEEALQLSEDRPTPPTLRFAGLDDDDDEAGAPRQSVTAAAPGDVPAPDALPAPDAVPVVAEMPMTSAEVSSESDEVPDQSPSMTVEAEPGEKEPMGSESVEKKAEEPEPEENEPAEPQSFRVGAAEVLRPAETFSPAYSETVYTPTSVYSSYNPTSLYTSGTSIMGSDQQEAPGTDSVDDAQDPGTEENPKNAGDQRS